jgi:hypothetical protein
LNRVLIFEPFISHTTPISTTIDIPLARWHVEDFDKTDTETNLRKALERLPPWTKPFDWSYVQEESSENSLLAQNTGIEVTARCWGEAHLKFKVVVAEWFGEKRNDVDLVPKNIEDLKNTLKDSYWLANQQTTCPVNIDDYIRRYQYYSSRSD